MSRTFNYAVQLLLTLATLILLAIFWSILKSFVWLILFPTVFIAARIGGFWGGLLATSFSALGMGYIFAGFKWTFFSISLHDAIALGLFILGGFLLSSQLARMQKTIRHANGLINELEASHQTVISLNKKFSELSTKTHYFASVSQELRTPLLLVLGGLRKHLESLPYNDPGRADFEIMARNGSVLQQHINDLLDVIKLEAGELPVEYSECDVAELTRIIASCFESTALERQIVYLSDIPRVLIGQIDIEKCQRILLHLLSNAFRFIADNGRVALKLSVNQDRMVFEVADDGPDIAEDLNEVLANPFGRIDNSGMRHFGGTDLGLAIIREFVSLLKGNIEVTRSAWGGALFKVTLPMQAPESVKHIYLSDQILFPIASDFFLKPSSAYLDMDVINSITDDPTPVILVVDENSDMRHFLRSLLEPKYSVLTAAEGQEALKIAYRQLPDLVITDLSLTKIEGDELLNILREESSLADIPMIVVSGRADELTRLKIIKSGAQAYFTKPFSVDELLARVANLLATSQRLSRKLEERDRRWLSALEAAGAGVWDWNIETGKVFYSELWKSMLGYPNSAFGDTIEVWREQIHADDLTTCFNALEAHCRGESDCFECEYRLCCRDGDYKWMLGRGRVLERTDDGQARRMVGTQTDITHLKVIDIALRASERRFQTIFNSVSDGLIVVEAANQMLQWNPAALKMHDLDTSEHYSAGFPKLVENLEFKTLDGQKLALEEWPKARVMRGDEFQNYEIQVKHKQKLWQRIYSFNGSVIKDSNGQTKMGLLSIRDLTSNKKTESRLHLQAAALNAATHAIMITDLNGELEWLNQAFTKLTGFSAEDAWKLNPRNLICSGEQSNNHYQAIWKAISNNQVWSGELKNQRKDGSVYIEEQTITPVADELGNVHHFVMIKQDISERKRTELIQTTQNDLLQMIASGKPLFKILEALTLAIEKLEPETLISILLLDDDEITLRMGAAPSLPAAYNKKIEGIVIGEGVGSCGTAVWRKAPVIVENIATDPLWKNFRELAAQFGLQACWSTPIKNLDGSVLGTFAVYFKTPQKPTQKLEEVVNMAIHVAAIALSRVREEQNLHQSEQIYYKLFSNMLDGFAHGRMIYQNDQAQDVVMLSVNQEFEQLTGLNNCVGRKITELIPWIKRTTPELFELFGRVASGGRPEKIELYIAPLTKWFAISVYCPKKSEFAAIFSGITERKQAEANLSKLSKAVEQSPEGILIANVNGAIEYVNDAFIRISGYQEAEIVGQNLQNVASEAQSEKSFNAIADALKLGNSWQGEMTRQRKDGSYYIAQEIYAPIRQNDGKITHYLLMLDDITEDKRIAEELDNYRSHLEEIVRRRSDEVSYLYNQAPCGYLSLDSDGMIVQINDTELAWLGYSRDEVVNKLNFKALIDVSQHAFFDENFPKFMHGGHFDALEFELTRKDGSSLPILLSVNAVFDAEGQFQRILSTAFDNRENKERERRIEILNEELRKRAKEAEIATQAKSIYLANMSHEIRTPMNAVLGFCYLLQQKALAQDAQTLVMKIQAAGHTLLGIINDILDFSKIEAGRLELESVPFRLSELIENITGIIGNLVGDKPLELIILPPPTDKINHLIGDPLRLQQVLINLLSNAVKFTASGEIKLKISVLDKQQNYMTLEFVVQDTGIGISQEKLDDIFRPFSQADNSTARQFGGTGLGLAISRQLVELMGGSLNVDSTVGQGSSFSFAINFKLDNNAIFRPQQLVNLNLLIGDDCENSREAVKNTSQILGWTADTAESGDATLRLVLSKMLAGFNYDVIILDWMMPDMDGLQTAKKIKAYYQDTPTVPIVIMVTAHSKTELMAQPDIVQIDSVLIKPISPSALYNAVFEAVSKIQQPVLSSQMESVSAQRLKGIRVLAIDDSEINLEVVRLILETEGAGVRTALTGQEGLEWLRLHPDTVDIILMDVQMPVMDGYAVTREIRKEPQWQTLPIIALSAGAYTNLQDAAIEAGMNGFIAKPINVELMIDQILQLTGNRPIGVLSKRPSEATEAGAVLNPITEYPGVELEFALRQWGKQEVYFANLEKFSDSYANIGKEVAVLIQQGDFKNADALVHKLVGSSANLALKQVADQARRIQEKFHGGEYESGSAELLQNYIDEACASIAKLLIHHADQQKMDSVPLPQEPMEPLLEQLLTALNTDTPTPTESLMKQLKYRLSEADWTTLNTCISNFDFRGAEQHVQTILRTLG